jgi:hypothetical protein
MIGLREQRAAFATMAAFATATALATFASGCAKQEAQRAVQSSLTGLAHGVNAADALVADAWPSAAERARAQVIEERDSSPGMTVEAGMARYEAVMSTWNRTLQVMRGAREVLYIGQAAFDVWLASGELPEQWITFCASAGEAVGHLVSLLGQVGLDVPLQLRGAGEYAARACELAAPWITEATLSPSGGARDERGQ